MMSIRTFLHRSFIAPFLAKGRVFSYCGSFLGAFGFTGVMTYFSYDFARLGAEALSLYFLVRLGFANFIAMPLALYTIYKLKRRFAFPFMLVLQAATMAYAFQNPNVIVGTDMLSVALAGLAFSIMAAPFWSSFHTCMLAHTSDDNIGNEVSVSGIILFCGGTLAIIGSGFALEYFPGPVYVLTCFASMMIGTMGFAISLHRFDMSPFREKSFSLIEAFKKHKAKCNATATEGLFQFLTSFFAPVWMWAIGIKSVTMGLLLASQGLIKLVVSPLAGHLFHEDKSRDVVLGATIKPLGWLPWIFIQAPWVMLISSTLWTLGQHLYSTGLGSRWYKQRCLASQALREILLGFGRCATACIALPLLYYIGPTAFFIFAFVATASLIFSAYHIKRDEQGDSKNKDKQVPETDPTTTVP